MTPTFVIFHTLALKGSYDHNKDGRIVDDVTRDHVARKFRTVGYQWLLPQAGGREEGRKETEEGAHCKDMGMNSKSIGIAFEGHGDFEHFTVQQITEFIKLAKEIQQRWQIPVKNFLGHRETGAPKRCPGLLIDCDAVRNLLYSVGLY